jgi:cytochrome b561
MTYGNPIRILHSLLALCMLAQLAVGELMDVPGKHSEASHAMMVITPAYAHEDHGAAMIEESWTFELHEALGLAIVALILIRIGLAFSSVPGAHWRNLFPWLSASGRAQLQSEVAVQANGWKEGRLAAPEDGESVARSVHGLMLLTVLGMAATGLALFFGWNEHGHQTEMIHMVGEAHEVLAGLVEALIALHIVAVILHIRGGHPIINRIRPFAK